MKRRTLIAAAVSAALMLAGGTALAQQPIVIKFSHVVANDTPKGKGADYFKKLAEERTKGRVKVEVYPNSQLYKDKEEMEALSLGAVQMLAPSLAKFGPLGVPAFEVFDLPFIFDSYAELHKVTQGPVGAALLARLEPKGIKGLAYWDNGFKVMSANKAAQGRRPTSRASRCASSPPRCSTAQMRSLGRQPAGDGLLRGLPGAADGRGGRHREPALQPLHPEDARGAEVRDALRPRLPRLRGHREQEVLGRRCRPTCAPRSRAR